MSLSTAQINQKISETFTYFEFQKFKNELSYDRRTNLVLEFCDYVESLEDWEILDLLDSEDIGDAIRFRQNVDHGADRWLDGLIKTICY